MHTDAQKTGPWLYISTLQTFTHSVSLQLQLLRICIRKKTLYPNSQASESSLSFVHTIVANGFGHIQPVFVCIRLECAYNGSWWRRQQIVNEHTAPKLQPAPAKQLPVRSVRYILCADWLHASFITYLHAHTHTCVPVRRSRCATFNTHGWRNQSHRGDTINANSTQKPRRKRTQAKRHLRLRHRIDTDTHTER